MKFSKNVIRFLLCIVLILVVFNVIVFEIPFFKKNSIFWLSYVFGMFAILVQAVVMKIAFTGTNTARSQFYGFPIARIGVVYAIAQVVLSIIFMIVGKFIPIWIPVILFVVLFGVAAIGFIATVATRDEIVRQDKKIASDSDVSFMRNLQSKMNLLVSQCNNAELRAEVKSLAEEIKYSDPVSKEFLKDIEREIFFYIEELQKAIVENDENSIELCKKAKSVLAERNRLCKLNKNAT